MSCYMCFFLFRLICALLTCSFLPIAHTASFTLAAAMEKYDCKKLMFSSSATVYGTPATLPASELTPVGVMTNPYGRSKYFQEELFRDISNGASTGSPWQVVLLRYFNPCGAHPSGLIGEDPQGIPNNLMPFIAQTAAGRRKQVSVFGNDYDTIDGTGVRDYIHVMDVAAGHVAALTEGLLGSAVKIPAGGKGNWCEIYNLGSGVGVSVLQLINGMSEAVGKQIPYEIVGRRQGDIGTCYGDASKAKRDLKWETKKNVKDLCADHWRFQRLNPEGFASISPEVVALLNELEKKQKSAPQ